MCISVATFYKAVADQYTKCMPFCVLASHALTCSQILFSLLEAGTSISAGPISTLPGLSLRTAPFCDWYTTQQQAFDITLLWRSAAFSMKKESVATSVVRLKNYKLNEENR